MPAWVPLVPFMDGAVVAGEDRFMDCGSVAKAEPGYGPGPEGVSGGSVGSSIRSTGASYSCSNCSMWFWNPGVG
jgi:hypothetical protein